jgi:hypothetical protein
VSLSSPALICTLLTNRKSDEHRLHKTPNERTGLVRQPSNNPLPTFSKKEEKYNRPRGENKVCEDIFAKEW